MDVYLNFRPIVKCQIVRVCCRIVDNTYEDYRWFTVELHDLTTGSLNIAAGRVRCTPNSEPVLLIGTHVFIHPFQGDASRPSPFSIGLTVEHWASFAQVCE